MSEKDNGGPAFGEFEKCGDLAVRRGGLSLRDYFAAKAMAGLMTAGSFDYKDETPSQGISRNAYVMADAMLAERAK